MSSAARGLIESGTNGQHSAPAVLRVLVVDDSVVMRQLITRILTEHPLCEVVGTARDGREAIGKIERLLPDLVTLDVEMPVLGGLDALRIMKERWPATQVIMCSSLTAQGAAVTIDALLAGADDYVTKQHSGEMHADAYESLRRSLSEKLTALITKRTRLKTAAAPTTLGDVGKELANAPHRLASCVGMKPQAVTIGISTGGPSALAELLPNIPSDFGLPLLIVQHMPPVFTHLLAERLAKLSRIAVVEGQEGMEVKPGCAIIAPGNYHMRVVRRAGVLRIALNQEPHENSCRPAVDVLFRSAADVYGGAVIALVMTGMGQDGLEGVRVLKDRGAEVLVQDQPSSVVWGMPGAIVSANLADAVLPLQEIAPAILRCA